MDAEGERYGEQKPLRRNLVEAAQNIAEAGPLLVQLVTAEENATKEDGRSRTILKAGHHGCYSFQRRSGLV